MVSTLAAALKWRPRDCYPRRFVLPAKTKCHWYTGNCCDEVAASPKSFAWFRPKPTATPSNLITTARSNAHCSRHQCDTGLATFTHRCHADIASSASSIFDHGLGRAPRAGCPPKTYMDVSTAHAFLCFFSPSCTIVYVCHLACALGPFTHATIKTCCVLRSSALITCSVPGALHIVAKPEMPLPHSSHASASTSAGRSALA